MLTKAFENARDKFVAGSAGKLTSVAAGAMIKEDGTFVYGQYNYPCHAYMSYEQRWGMNKGDKAFSLNLCINLLKGLDKPTAMHYIHWLTNLSPWAEVFITKDPEDILARGYVARHDVPNNLLVGAFIATRFITENMNGVERINFWREAVNFGMDPALAFVYAHSFVLNEKNKIHYSCRGSGHASIDPNMGWKAVDNFVSNNQVATGKNYDECYTYSGIHSLWGTKNGEMKFVNFCQAVRPLTDCKVVNLNIFYKEDLSKGTFVFETDKHKHDLFVQLIQGYENVINEMKIAA